MQAAGSLPILTLGRVLTPQGLLHQERGLWRRQPPNLHRSHGPASEAAGPWMERAPALGLSGTRDISIASYLLQICV